MAGIGGSIESISLDGRNFSVAADADVSRKIGGWENEVQSNGDGTFRIIKTRVASSLGGISLSIDDTRGDAEYLNELQGRKDSFPMAITLASGVVYQGDVAVVGEISTSLTNSTAEIELGGGKLTRQ